MPLRPNESSLFNHSLLRAVPVAAAVLMLSACVGGGDADGPGNGGNDGGSDDGGNGGGNQASKGEVAASSLTTSLESGDDFKIDVYPIRRISDDVALLDITVTNTGTETNRLSPNLAGMRKSTTAEGVTLIDSANRKRHMPLQKTDDQCLCSDFKGQERVDPGDSVDIWVAYPAPPADVDAMTVATLASPDFVDIPLLEASGEEEEIAQTATADPEIRDISSIQMGEEETREDSGDESKIMLSSDVLFKVNESDLTDKADTALKKVAKEIDDSSADEVSIDGYTDNTGNDSINNPLSKDRAESVQKRLEDLVSRDVNFSAEGHGSSDPIASNDNEEGREQNRRVTISFAK
ncbi:outer membrane protein OmpA-like peptidoglycan-associated protein [Nocardiopsis mwathae]|uniref:Outer membrane protein OmpA-like peptidoglycan-associated protein n=1 Tax=Nocardiopsis mwathae TaxID=1472723 RepID=A0A7X0D3W6_9ACTN|nr:OmpA family protein [Nocardiopsis mwathae]MBB6170657.1 outer membrane protein OmpA-like peptidoglycan-associated protein [Nocardiopsis mwathae]